jgi:hypothetical protein
MVTIDILKHHWDDKPLCGECNMCARTERETFDLGELEEFERHEEVIFCKSTGTKTNLKSIACKHFE